MTQFITRFAVLAAICQFTVWLTEGLAALAQGECQGHTVDALAAGYLELPGYLAGASLADFIRRRYGVSEIRRLWQGQAPDSIMNDLQSGGKLESEWRSFLSNIPPATFDSARLYREGC